MKRPNRRRPRHAKPPQAQQTVTAIIIISFFIAAVLIGLLLLICASHKLAGGANGKPPTPHSVVSSSPLGGVTGNYNKSLRKAPVESAPIKPTVTTLPTEPLEGGGTATNGMETATNSPAAPQQRDRPAIEAMQSAVVEAQQARVRADLVARINAFLGNSPLAGLGECMMANAERTGVWVMLCPAQAYAESSLGAACCYPYQPFGMYGVHPSSWEDAIVRYFDNIVAHWGLVQNAHELVNPDYCEPPEPYNSNVQRLAESI